MHRRKFAAVLAAAIALSTAGGVSAAPVETKTLPAENLFPFLRNYYALPAAERTQFHLGYALRVQGARPDQINLTLQDGANKIRMVPDAQGYLSPMPTDAQLKAKAKLSLSRPADAKCSISLEVLPNQSPAQSMEAKPLALAVSQAHTGSKKLAGLLAMAMPTLDRVNILGVTSGEVKLANGTTRPLPFTPASTSKTGGHYPAHLTFVPADMPGAVALTFNGVPTRLLIGSKD
ncbi:hypothetical protein [Asticcacaulis sp. 201]|uniref:hypothetical protein n=1 Tax=Asticcacaulis sp. 201 TaxID=3028787 RepID=UPI002916F615|nr:hypothetical protein [Asticcacaulis sp. 201]MDV6329691.1 hypothetical protein [Asticcacaulis sp. 201]